MDEARRVIERLERIEELKREGALARELLAEVWCLLAEGERWLEAERAAAAPAADAVDVRPAEAAVERCRARLGPAGGEREGVVARPAV